MSNGTDGLYCNSLRLLSRIEILWPLASESELHSESAVVTVKQSHTCTHNLLKPRILKRRPPTIFPAMPLRQLTWAAASSLNISVSGASDPKFNAREPEIVRPDNERMTPGQIIVKESVCLRFLFQVGCGVK
jgi:hypothetical protein